jgi:hypothetical protein
MSRTFEAKHTGSWCFQCRHSITPGQAVRVETRNTKRVMVHADESECTKRTSKYRRTKKRAGR